MVEIGVTGQNGSESSLRPSWSDSQVFAYSPCLSFTRNVQVLVFTLTHVHDGPVCILHQALFNFAKSTSIAERQTSVDLDDFWYGRCQQYT